VNASGTQLWLAPHISASPTHGPDRVYCFNITHQNILNGELSMRIHYRVFSAIMALCLAAPALAASSAPYAKGGRTKDFSGDVEQYRQSGELFRITGHCLSACTMSLALRNVCVEPSARLLFHGGENDTATRRMMNSYNAGRRNYLTARRVMESPRFTPYRAAA